MVSILPAERTPIDVIMKQVSSGLQEHLPQAVQQYAQRNMLRNSLDEISQIANNPQASPLDISLAAMKAGAGIPGSERYLGQLIPELVKFANARRMQESPLAGEQQAPVTRDREPVERPQPREQLPAFLGRPDQTSQFFPTNIGSQQGLGNVPQQATSGQKEQLLTPSEMIPASKKLAKERTAAGIPTTPQEAMQEIKAREEDKRLHNQAIDAELAQRVKGQQTYGNRAVDYLKRKFPDNSPPTPEMEAIFQKMGEDASKRGESEAEINRYLAKEAEKFRNTFVNVEKSVSAPRLINSIGRAAEGTYKDLETAGADIRRHLQPLLDLGLFDTARNLLSQKNYGPEESEAIIHPMGPQENAILTQVPSVPKNKVVGSLPGSGPIFGLGDADINNVKDALRKLKAADSNFSLLLARKGIEDKNYDWRMFKDALNQLETEEGFELTDDQTIQRGFLDTPPLNRLESILKGLNLIGR